MSYPIRLHRDYTVAWFCSLPTDILWATKLLDQRHDDLPKPPNDINTYTLGAIGELNVVIYGLPFGVRGNHAAATATAWMLSTFPCIKFGVVVGGAGGAPQRVQLGDVVVGTRVIPWDLESLSHEGPEGIRESQMHLNNPPAVLLTALSKLLAGMRANSAIDGFLPSVRCPRPDGILRQLGVGDPTDIVFPVGTPHLEEAASTTASQTYLPCRRCDKTNATTRRPRLQGGNIYIGLVATGNLPMQDAAHRDKLSEDFQNRILCFDTETAGLANNLPCLVVRGISSYADEHSTSTNRAWEEFAAAEAAGIAKGILYQAQPRGITDTIRGYMELDRFGPAMHIPSTNPGHFTTVMSPRFSSEVVETDSAGPSSPVHLQHGPMPPSSPQSEPGPSNANRIHSEDEGALHNGVNGGEAASDPCVNSHAASEVGSLD
ncbi:hypothetical protein VTK56DRAFT_5954 [Thermocarpiscus australiensis]